MNFGDKMDDWYKTHYKDMEEHFNALFFAVKRELNLVPLWSKHPDNRKWYCNLVDAKDYPVWECNKCKWSWVSRNNKPTKCPKCQNKNIVVR